MKGCNSPEVGSSWFLSKSVLQFAKVSLFSSGLKKYICSQFLKLLY